MARAQNSAKGRFTKKQQVIPASGGIIFATYSATVNLLSGDASGLKIANRTNAVLNGDATGLTVKGGIKLSTRTSAVITGNSTGIVLAGGVKVSSKLHIKANSTAWAFGSTSVKPSTRDATYKWAFMKSGGGTGYLAINTTATTWKYVQVTSTLNTTSGYA